MAFAFLHKKLLQNYSYAASFIRHTQPSLNFRFYCKNVVLPEQKADNIVSLFKSYGFTENQISSLIIKKPVILSQHPHPEKTLKPKLDFFNSVGLSSSDLRTIITLDTHCFNDLSLENQLIPSYEYLKTVLHTTENVNSIIKRAPQLLWPESQKYMAQNIDAMRERGIPGEKIVFLLKTQPSTMILQSDKFNVIVSRIKNMGFDPRTSHFLAATRTLAGLEGSNWEKKKGMYRKWGWSDEDILAAFKKAPACMAASDKKIETAMDFLVDKMGFSPSEIAECPHVIYNSLGCWTIPRCLVYQFLLSKGLIQKKRLAYVISVNEQHFLDAFLSPYSAQFPELVTIYETKVKDAVPYLAHKSISKRDA